MPQTPLSNDAPDVIVIGAGAAGLAASDRLRELGVAHLVLEAQDRLGGRAHTVVAEGEPLDLGCGWLHSARRNAWTAVAERLGFAIDRSLPAWNKPALEANFPLAEQAAYREAFGDLDARLEAAAEADHDQPASNILQSIDSRWRPLLNAFSGYYNGAPFEEISVKDYAAYQPTDDNWRLCDGYGALIARFGADLPVRLNTPVLRIEHGGGRVRVVTAEGPLEARAVIVAVPTTVLAEGRLTFDPPLPAKREAAAALPLGHVNKAFLALDGDDDFGADRMIYGDPHREDTGGYTLRPMGRPVVEGFFGGDLAGELEEKPGALCAFAIEELTAALGSDFRKRLRPLASSAWARNPFILGAYSHARPGCAGMRAALAAPVDGRLFFAGEACSPHAFSTAHGAYETGVVAADAAVATLKSRRP